MINEIEMRGITKIYGANGLTANDGVDFSLEKGEIHALAGENGAGKTTLMRILYGMEKPTAGSISVRGRTTTIDSPLGANRLGIGMVHQHFMLIPDFTVAQNVVLGTEPIHYRIRFDEKTAIRRVERVIEEHHFSIEPEARVSQLTVGQMQQVEIVKMLYRDVDTLILDEPTAVLTEQEIDRLFITLQKLSEAGKSLILITHKLHEIKRLSHRLTVLRRGRKITTCSTEVVDEKEISRLMVGKSVMLQVEKEFCPPGEAVLEFKDVTVLQKGQRRPLLNSVSFTARGGEILAFAGVGGNGLGILESVLGGMRSISSGVILHKGREISRTSAKSRRTAGLAYVPADRLSRGCNLSASVEENLIISSKKEYSRYGILLKKKLRRHCEKLLADYSVSGSSDMTIGSLSGGNIQKVILAREIHRHEDYIIFSEPTWGLDVAGSQYVYARMAELREEGTAVILLSSNLDEILALADRILVFYRGAVVAEMAGSDTPSKEEIGEYMLGIKTQEKDGATCCQV